MFSVLTSTVHLLVFICLLLFCCLCYFFHCFFLHIFVHMFQPMSSIVVMPEAKTVIAGSWDNNMYVDITAMYCVNCLETK